MNYPIILTYVAGCAVSFSLGWWQGRGNLVETRKILKRVQDGYREWRMQSYAERDQLTAAKIRLATLEAAEAKRNTQRMAALAKANAANRVRRLARVTAARENAS